MSFSKLYLIFALGVFSALSYAVHTGYSFADVDEVHVPKTVRSNPGSYRSHYSSHGGHRRRRSHSSFFFFGGK